MLNVEMSCENIGHINKDIIQKIGYKNHYESLILILQDSIEHISPPTVANTGPERIEKERECFKAY